MNLGKLSNLNLKQKITLNIFVFLAVSGCLTYFVILPAAKSIKTIKTDIEEQRIDLEKRYMKGQSLRKLIENLEMIETKLAKLDEIFIDKNNALGFITTLEEIANKSNVSQKINLMEETNKKNEIYQKIPVQLLTTDGFKGQMQYIINIEALNYYINIKSLELSTLKKNTVGSNTDSDSTVGSSLKMLILADSYWK